MFELADLAGTRQCPRLGNWLMRCPACNKHYVHDMKHYERHLLVCRGTYPFSLVVGGGDPSRPPLLRLVPTAADWLWASTFSVTEGVSRRLPRLYRKIPHALPVEVQRAYSLLVSRIQDVGGDVGAWRVFLMMQCLLGSTLYCH